MPSIHFEVKPISCLLRSEFLYNMEQGFGEYVPVKIFAISSYPGSVPTFNCLVNNKFSFHYLPVQAFASKECGFLSETKDSSYFNCPSGDLAVSYFDVLKKTKCQVFHRNGSFRGLGTCILTLDWYNDNDLCHLINMDSGHFCLWPSHKIVFEEAEKITTLPSYKKLRGIWRV